MGDSGTLEAVNNDDGLTFSCVPCIKDRLDLISPANLLRVVAANGCVTCLAFELIPAGLPAAVSPSFTYTAGGLTVFNPLLAAA